MRRALQLKIFLCILIFDLHTSEAKDPDVPTGSNNGEALNRKVPIAWSTWSRQSESYVLHQSGLKYANKQESPRSRQRDQPQHSGSNLLVMDGCRSVYPAPEVCEDVYERYKMEYALDGDIILAGLFPIHLGVGCSTLEDMGSIQRMEAMAHAVQTVNSWPNFFGDFKIGFRIFDTCNSQSTALARTLNVLPHCINCSHYPICIPECPALVTGIVGPESSSNTLLSAHACNLALTPLISYFATSLELTDRTVFPTLFTTVPSDDYQVSAMLDLLERFGWTYFSVVHTDDRYGKDALDYIQMNMREMCLAAVVQVSASGVNNTFETAVETLLRYKDQSDARAVIVFTDGRSANRLFEAVEKAGAIGEFIWIGSEGWGVSLNDISEMLHVAQGSVTFTPHTEFDPKFDQYFQNLPINRTDNPWWREIWSYHFNCSYDLPADDEKSCWRHEHIDASNGYVPDSTVSLVSDSVYAFAYAISDYVNKTGDNVTFDARGKPVIPPWKLIEFIRDTSFPGRALDRTVSLGSPLAYYDVKNLQVNDTGWFDYVNVGTWTSTEGLVLDEDAIQWPGRKQAAPRSFCSSECGPGQIQILLKISCCWDCEECARGAIVSNDSMRCEFCPDFYWPNANFSECLELELQYVHWDEPIAILILAINTLLFVLIIFSSFYMIKHRNDRLVKASGRELMVIIMFGVLVQVILVPIIIAMPTQATCFIVRFVFGVDVTITYSAILVKSNRIYRIFSQGKKSVKPPVFVKKYQQLLFAFSLIIIQVIIVATLCYFYPPQVTTYQPAPDVAELSCAIEEITVLIPLGYNLLIIFPCLYYGWKTRHLPVNFNESRYIAFTVCSTMVIWVAFIPIYLTIGTNLTTTSEIHVAILCTAELMSAFITLASFFFPKLYALRFVPTTSWNVASAYKSRRITSCLSQCDYCGSIYNNKEKQQREMHLNSLNNRATSVIHRSALSSEVNRFGRRRASSFGEAIKKIQIAKNSQPEAEPKVVEVESTALEKRRSSHRSCSAPDLWSLVSKESLDPIKVERSKTEFIQVKKKNKEFDNIAEPRSASTFYLNVSATPRPSRASSALNVDRRSSSVTPSSLTAQESRALAFMRPFQGDYFAPEVLVVNGLLAPPKSSGFSRPRINLPNEVPASPELLVEPRQKQSRFGGNSGLDSRSITSEDAIKPLKIGQRSNFSDKSKPIGSIPDLNVIPCDESPDMTGTRPRARVVAYSKKPAASHV